MRYATRSRALLTRVNTPTISLPTIFSLYLLTRYPVSSEESEYIDQHYRGDTTMQAAYSMLLKNIFV